MAVLDFTLPPDSGEKLSLGQSTMKYNIKVPNITLKIANIANNTPDIILNFMKTDSSRQEIFSISIIFSFRC